MKKVQKYFAPALKGSLGAVGGYLLADQAGKFATETFPTADTRLISGGKVALGAGIAAYGYTVKGDAKEVLVGLGLGMAAKGGIELYEEFSSGTTLAPPVSGYRRMAGVVFPGPAGGSAVAGAPARVVTASPSGGAMVAGQGGYSAFPSAPYVRGVEKSIPFV